MTGAPQFKAGERVRCVGPGQSPYYHAGSTGTVVLGPATRLGVWVQWDAPHFQDGIWCAKPGHLELIEAQS